MAATIYGAIMELNKTMKGGSSSASGAGLPAVSAADNGSILMVSNGAWAVMSIPTQLPTVSAADAGQVLTVNSSGVWAAASLPSG